MPALVPPNTNGWICVGPEFVADCEMVPSLMQTVWPKKCRFSSPVSLLQTRTYPRLSAAASRSMSSGR
jgi:hypothetical protein